MPIEHHEEDAAHHRGLLEDLRVLSRKTERRDVLRMLACAALAPLASCLDSSTPRDGKGDAGVADDASSDAGTSAQAGASANDAGSGSCATIPEETAGPYPGDGSNGANALLLSGIVRSDIRQSLSPATGLAEGVQLTIKVRVVDLKSDCAGLEGAAVYVWQCNRDGEYSMYSSDVANENYLRGVQETDADGWVTFTSIFPACYAGRWPHIHFEIYPSTADITSASNKLATSQMALPEDVCSAVFATTGYSQSVSNLSRISLSSDNVFSDGVSLQTPAITGSVSAGYVASLTVGV